MNRLPALVLAVALSVVSALTGADDSNLDALRDGCRQGAYQVLLSVSSEVEAKSSTLEEVIERLRKIAKEQNYSFAPMEALLRGLFDDSVTQDQFDRLFNTEVENCVTFYKNRPRL